MVRYMVVLIMLTIGMHGNRRTVPLRMKDPTLGLKNKGAMRP